MRRPEKRRPAFIGMFVLVLIIFAVPYVYISHSAGTCGPSDEDMIRFMSERMGDRGFTVLKTAQEGRIKAVLYEADWSEDTTKLCIMEFERRLFGMRWQYLGMNTVADGELGKTGGWNSNGRCEVVVYGDNSGGAVSGYRFLDAPEVCRDNLESDYILDIYILDGIESLPRQLFLNF